MPLVGTMDIALGILALVAPLQGVWVWMTGWAVWTAVFRHCATDWGQQDRRDPDLSLRENQRNLSAGGEADARALNAAFRALGIPVSSVESSTMFRCRETASLAFNDVVTTRELVGSDGGALRRRLTQAPPGQGNGVCVTHQVTIWGPTPPWCSTRSRRATASSTGRGPPRNGSTTSPSATGSGSPAYRPGPVASTTGTRRR
ncbi:MAG: hypothetical protein EBR86_02245 [Planctomycetia bacterium]|nr:hypothetical protein [Planctomycetia bacterium]